MIETIPSTKRPLVTGSRTAICGLVFLVSGSIVYWTAARRTEAPKNYRATATIVQHAAAGAHAADTIATFRPDSEAIRRQVLSDDGLRRIVACSRPGAAPALTAAQMESIRGQLRFASPADPAGSCLASISFTDGQPEQALRLVNEAARCYAGAHRAAVAAMIAKANDQAAEAVRESRKQWQQAEDQRSEFLRQPAPVESQTEPPKAAALPAKSHWVDNPQWTDLQRTHDDLVRRRQALLVTRTPLHPEVLVVNDLIAQSEAKLASLPRRLPVGDTDATTWPGATAGLPSSADAGTRRHGDVATVSPGGHAGIAGNESAQRNQQRLALDAAVQQARARLDQALQTQRTSQGALAHVATIEVHPAERCEAVVAAPPAAWRFLPLALASGLALATAAGMFFTGLSVDPVLIDVAQLQASLSSPLLGPVPVPAGRSDGPAAAGALSVRALNAWGAILVVVCTLAIGFAFAAR
jgi:hypothetical protein